MLDSPDLLPTLRPIIDLDWFLKYIKHTNKLQPVSMKDIRHIHIVGELQFVAKVTFHYSKILHSFQLGTRPVNGPSFPRYIQYSEKSKC
jgi:hypothetical protein